MRAGDDEGRRRGTVGIYDRPASVDRRARVVKLAAWAIAAAAALGGWWWAGTPGLG